MRTLKVYSFKNFQACSPASLTTAAGAAHCTPITDLLYEWRLAPVAAFIRFTPVPSSRLLFLCFFILDSTYKWDHVVFVFLFALFHLA